MLASRRSFLIGGAAFGTLGAFGGSRFIFAATGCKKGESPRLRFGVVSDIHITRVGANERMEAFGNNLTFRHALEWFREQNVDAVVIAGDMADRGLDDNLMPVAEAWYSVFPNDRYPDGRPIEKVFVTGNHDWEGYKYGDAARKLHPDKAELDRHVLKFDMPGFWEKAFHEPYAPIYQKKIKGYTFIGAHWDMGGFGKETGKEVYAFGRIHDFMSHHGKDIDPALPFFYVQHPHPKNTCYGPWAWGRDKGIATKTLSSYANAIAFSGHSHYTLTDERSVWQGAFTSVGTSSLRYTGLPYNECPPAGYENSRAGAKKEWRIDAEKLLGRFSTGDCRQGMLWSVYDDCIVVRRREFLSNLDLGADWVLPLPASESRPFAFAEHAKRLRAPEFAAGAALDVSVTTAKNRGGKSKDGKDVIPARKKSAYKVVAPLVVADESARVFSVEFTAEAADGKKFTKRVIAGGFNHSLKHKNAGQKTVCLFARDALGSGDVCFTATPVNCFGARGKLIETRYASAQ